jgi:hypothetical protein
MAALDCGRGCEDIQAAVSDMGPRIRDVWVAISAWGPEDIRMLRRPFEFGGRGYEDFSMAVSKDMRILRWRF